MPDRQGASASCLDLGTRSFCQAARGYEGRVERVLPVCGHNDLYVCRLVEAVHLVEELEQNPLHFSVRASLAVKALGSNGVNFVDEDD